MDAPLNVSTQTNNRDVFSSFIPVSADSQDILSYINQPLEARKPVVYQGDLLDVYQPNKTWHLSATLRMQLHKMGKTTDSQVPAGIYSRLDTHELIEHGKSAQGIAAIGTQMILNHESAIELLVENINSAEFNLYTLMSIHSALSENLLLNPADEGRMCQHAVEQSFL